MRKRLIRWGLVLLTVAMFTQVSPVQANPQDRTALLAGAINPCPATTTHPAVESLAATADSVEQVSERSAVYWQPAQSVTVPAAAMQVAPSGVYGVTEDGRTWKDTAPSPDKTYTMHVRYGVLYTNIGCDNDPDEFSFRARTWCTVNGNTTQTPCARRLFVSSLFFKPCQPSELCTVTEPWGNRDFLEAGTGEIVSQGLPHAVALQFASILSNTRFVEFEFTAPNPNHVTFTYRFCSRWVNVINPIFATAPHSSGCSGALIPN